MTWEDILKNIPSILSKEIKRILTLKWVESADRYDQNEMGYHSGSKEVKYDGGYFKIQIDVNDLGGRHNMYARIYSTPKTGIKFDYRISTKNGEDWEEKLIEGKNDIINEETQRKILTAAERMRVSR